VIDEIIEEPFGGAHRDWEQSFQNTKTVLKKNLLALLEEKPEDLKTMRYDKFRKMGVFEENK